MVTSRWIEEKDRHLLETLIAEDEFHSGSADFFYEKDTVCTVWELDGSPVLFIRGNAVDESSLCLNIQFVSNNDKHKNIKAMIAAFGQFTKTFPEHGFKRMIFQSLSPKLVVFCQRYFGFVEVDGTYIKTL